MSEEFIKATYKLTAVIAIFGLALGLTALIAVIVLAYAVLP